MGQRGRARREELGLPILTIAEMLGVTHRRLSQMEQDGVEGLTQVCRWADVLGMPAVELAFGIKKKGKKVS